MAFRKTQPKKPGNSVVELAIAALDGSPNPLDLDVRDLDPSPTSLDLALPGEADNRHSTKPGAAPGRSQEPSLRRGITHHHLSPRICAEGDGSRARLLPVGSGAAGPVKRVSGQST